jgi:hypothetical protein
VKKVFLLVFVGMISSLFIACSSVTVDDYSDRSPSIDVETFFTGDLLAYGIVRNRSGKVTRYFSAVLKGRWEQGVGTLEEVFWFNDGERQTRTWVMMPEGDDTYSGTAGDVEGSAKIQSRGNAIHLAYKLRVPYQNKEIVVSMDDWMYQVVPGVVINETVMTKWGFEVAKVTLVIMKSDAANDMPALIEKFDE